MLTTEQHASLRRPEKGQPRLAAPVKLGLCLSGGGYRAAGFHLGVLGYLNEIGWLSTVTALSTVSGGTIVGAAWALSRTRSESFEAFSARFRTTLLETNLIEETLHDYAKTKRSRERARPPSLARSLAEAYAAPSLFGDARLADLRGPASAPLEIRLNATEFDRAFGFRFVVTKRRGVVTGSRFDVLNVEDSDRLRVADVVAASSCFPGAFEPFLFPSDFRMERPPVVQRVEYPAAGIPLSPPPIGFLNRAARGGADEFTYSLNVPLMDGGIFDNQGIDAMLDIESTDDVETVMISDSDRRPNHAYLPPVPSHPKPPFLLGRFTPSHRVTVAFTRRRIWLLWLCAAAVLLAAAAGAWLMALDALGLRPLPGHQRDTAALAGATVLFAGLVTHIVFGLRLWWTGRGLWAEQVVPRLGGNVAQRIADVASAMAIADANHMVKTRAASIYAMLYDVFAARIRRLGYEQAYPNLTMSTGVPERYAHQRISTLIYHLSSGTMHADLGPTAGPEQGIRLAQSFSRLAATASLAENYGTVLWFEREGGRSGERQLDALICTGRATCCINLLKYAIRRARSNGWSDELVELWNKAATDWNELADGEPN